jgi:hypothetical protein
MAPAFSCAGGCLIHERRVFAWTSPATWLIRQRRLRHRHPRQAAQPRHEIIVPDQYAPSAMHGGQCSATNHAVKATDRKINKPGGLIQGVSHIHGLGGLLFRS